MSLAPESRRRSLNHRPLRRDGLYVVYWMVAHRRLEWNHALDHALALARSCGVGLVILEALRVDHRWSAPRHHRFVLDGMREHRDRLAGLPVEYLPYVEPAAGAGQGLLETLAGPACAVVTDDYPVFFLPRMQAAAASRLEVPLHQVDSNGILPMRAAGRTFTMAVHFRRHLQKEIVDHLALWPDADPLSGLELPAAPLPEGLLDRWPMAGDSLLGEDADLAASLPLRTRVPPVSIRGGAAAGRKRLHAFLDGDLARYGEGRNEPDDDRSSRLSPWLHWGHLSPHEAVFRLIEREEWSPVRVAESVKGKREGWWGMSAGAEAWLDELITWRELGFNFAAERPEAYDDYGALPEWALATLADHRADPREHLYDLDAFDGADTHDALWNAAQRQLRVEGTIHNYLRMLWGKKILEWTPDPESALDIMIELNNRYAIDGRDPNSWSGIFWVLGRFDRGWPERAIYGKVRSMSSRATRRKVSVDNYLQRFGKDRD